MRKLSSYRIPLSRPDITDLERKAVSGVLNTPYLSLGPKIKEFERKISAYVGVKFAVAVNSGTSGLHLVIRALGIKDGDEVITTPFSFISSANCILYERAKPVFVDIDPLTLNIDTNKIEKAITKKTKAILAVDTFAHPAEWDELRRIARKHNLKLIEDSAEGLGSEYKGRKCGTLADAAVFSFYPNKQITTGEGGVVVTNSRNIADFCRSVSNQGRKVHGGKWLEHFKLGYNYRMSDITAALGVAQLSRIKSILKKRNEVARKYNHRLTQVPEVRIPYAAGDVKLSWFIYVIRLSQRFSKNNRDWIIRKMAQKGIQCSDYFLPIPLQPFYLKAFKYRKGSLPVCEETAKRTIALPFYNNLSDDDINFVVNNLKTIIAKC